ncbi:uncharacterized protein K444DRAFT_644242 [Hyaloscypha bicolor E]|uniref:Uncharacterized protein n=1 Tax=Hyaloscypha bicolor E TaxID=1095630 RepID=A0A2J6T4M3_9HELO|nr:uncharacterized protein K444DRAFT_644242 [Hyaloscypha bicolor E]PMD57969.1 hypothetical protein K444DRAFT_644242 [Hyaloscypha bicolor E]
MVDLYQDAVTAGLKVGQCIKGKVGSYILSKQLHKDIWTATCEALLINRSPLSLTLNRYPSLGKVIIKNAPKYLLEIERNVLMNFNGRPRIRRLLDETQNPPSLVLKRLDDNPLNVGPHRFREAGLGDCGDACFVNSKDHLKPGKNGYMIGAHTFRNTWSFGTTLISLIWRLG